MNLHWIVGKPIERVGDRLTSSMASVRYRVLIPVEHLSRRGIRSGFTTIDLDTPLDSGLLDSLGPIDALVVSKSYNPGSLQLARQAKRNGIRVVVDLCDNRLTHPADGPHHLALIRAADQVVASTGAIRDAVAHHALREAVVIADPFEGPHGAVRFAPDPDRLRLLWFGFPSNLEPLFKLIPTIHAAALPATIDLNLVTAPLPALIDTLRRTAAQLAPRLSIRLTPWSPDRTWQALSDCDLVVLPGEATEYFLAKGANRLIETLRAGRFAVGFPIPAYLDFSESAWIDRDLVAGLRWALAHPFEVRRRIQSGQARVAESHAPDVIASAWERILADALEPATLS